MTFPSLSLNVEGVDVAEGNASVVETSVTAIDPEFALPHASTSVDTRWGRTNGGLLVAGNSLVAGNAGPRVVRALEPPRVVETLGGGGVATINKHSVVLRCGECDVLSTRRRNLVSCAFLLLPSCLF